MQDNLACKKKYLRPFFYASLAPKDDSYRYVSYRVYFIQVQKVVQNKRFVLEWKPQ